MTDVLWPPDLIPSMQTWKQIGNAAQLVSPLSGATKTYGRPGVRMGCTITLPPVRGSDRARVQAVLGALRDRGNRIWMPDFTSRPRTDGGSFNDDELFTNNAFASGTTGWTPENVTLSVADRVMRVAAVSVGTQDYYQSVALTQNAPHALRTFLMDGQQTSGLNIGPALSNAAASNIGTARGLVTVSHVPSSGASQSQYPALLTTTSGYTVGSYFSVHWSSLARCFQVDGGGNLLLHSDAFDTGATWGLVGATISANATTAPDGTSTADALTENGAGGTHVVGQSVTVVSSAADYAFCVAVKAANRSFCMLEVEEGTGSTDISQYFNLSTAAVGTNGATGANWSNRRAFAASLGDGWVLCVLIGRKTNAATDLTVRVYGASADGTNSYTGGSFAALRLWRGTLAQSSMPSRLVQSTSSAVSASAQTGNGIYVKGLPASTSGLLLAGKMVQIGSQINRVIAALDSDASGSGYLLCANPWRAATNDAPVIVNTPMCKMIPVGDIDIETGPAQFSSFQIELEEAVE